MVRVMHLFSVGQRCITSVHLTYQKTSCGSFLLSSPHKSDVLNVLFSQTFFVAIHRCTSETNIHVLSNKNSHSTAPSCWLCLKGDLSLQIYEIWKLPLGTYLWEVSALCRAILHFLWYICITIVKTPQTHNCLCLNGDVSQPKFTAAQCIVESQICIHGVLIRDSL